METRSMKNPRNNWRRQVARSRGNEWMISSYNAWQQASPIGSKPKKFSTGFLQVVSRKDKNEGLFESVISLSLKVIAILSGLIILAKFR
jgi:hypothetical protein